MEGRGLLIGSPRKVKVVSGAWVLCEDECWLRGFATRFLEDMFAVISTDEREEMMEKSLLRGRLL